MINPDTKSYPYLAIAQRFNVNYGLVLTFADVMAGVVDPSSKQAQASLGLPAAVRHAVIARMDPVPPLRTYALNPYFTSQYPPLHG